MTEKLDLLTAIKRLGHVSAFLGKKDGSQELLDDLEYVDHYLNALNDVERSPVSTKASPRQLSLIEEELPGLDNDEVPEEVRKWIESTFAPVESASTRFGDIPSFKSVANAIRTGIFLDRIFRTTSLHMHIPTHVKSYLDLRESWEFDPITFTDICDGCSLRYMTYDLLCKRGFIHKYKINPSSLENMLVGLENGYSKRKKPYHNNMHACDVLQTLDYLIHSSNLMMCLTDLEIFGCIIAAAIHDYDHTGTTNNFHINSYSNLALLYNDKSVLESHHVSSFFRLANEEGCNIFAEMDKSEFRTLRSLIITMVLHTDMSSHFSQIKAIKMMLQQLNLNNNIFNNNNNIINSNTKCSPASGRRRISLSPASSPLPISAYNSTEISSMDRPAMLSLMLHACDVSHPSKPWDIHNQWTARCLDEFFHQGDLERQMGLEYSPLCDKHTTHVPQSQIGFIDFIVIPTMNILGDVMDAMSSIYHKSDETEKSSSTKKCVDRPWNKHLRTNRLNWVKKLESGDHGIYPYPEVNFVPLSLSPPSSLRPTSTPSERCKDKMISSQKQVVSSFSLLEDVDDVTTVEQQKKEGCECSSSEGDEQEVDTGCERREKNESVVMCDNMKNKKVAESCVKKKIHLEMDNKSENNEEIHDGVTSRPGSTGINWRFQLSNSQSILKESTPISNGSSTDDELYQIPEIRKSPLSIDKYLSKPGSQKKNQR